MPLSLFTYSCSCIVSRSHQSPLLDAKGTHARVPCQALTQLRERLGINEEDSEQLFNDVAQAGRRPDTIIEKTFITTINRIAIITAINRIAIITTINRIAIITTIHRIAIRRAAWPRQPSRLRAERRPGLVCLRSVVPLAAARNQTSGVQAKPACPDGIEWIVTDFSREEAISKVVDE